MNYDSLYVSTIETLKLREREAATWRLARQLPPRAKSSLRDSLRFRLPDEIRRVISDLRNAAGSWTQEASAAHL